MNLMEDKMALKELVDTFSILADQKDIASQVLLFDEEAVVKSYMNCKLVSDVKGRKEICDTFAGFLALFDTVYHINGQQVVEVNGDAATGKAYCQVVLIGENEGKRIMSTQGICYDDEYIRKEGKWLIANRTSHFVWSDRKEI